jgi:hypothetical protein
MLSIAFLGTAHATAFYIDASSGNDANTGTSPSQAWSSLAPVNQHKFKSDDQIFFHAGQTWAGVLEPHGSGTADHPITLGSYGEGAKPLIKGEGADATLVLRDVSGWTVQDIAVTNHGDNNDPHVGVLIRTSHFSFAIHLLRVDVSDVNGELGKSAGGIGIVAWGKDGDSAHFDDVLIDHCTVSHVDSEGIWLHVTDSELRTYRNTHVRITGTTITDTGRNAIYLRGTLDGLIDHNVVRLAAAHHHGNAVCIGWAKGTIVRDNEVSETGIHTGDHENGAFDVDDGAIESIVEYNWSHDNVGGMVNVGTQPGRDCDAYGTIIRYNLSENDGLRVFGVFGADHGTSIYNNTAYIGKGHSPRLIQAGQFTHYPQLPDGILFARNVFFSEGKSSFDWHANKVMVDGNCYLGKSPDGPPADEHMVKDKTLHLSGVPIHDRNEAVRYRIPSGSDCAGPSPKLPNLGDNDFLGTPLDAKTTGTRGALVSTSELTREIASLNSAG